MSKRGVLRLLIRPVVGASYLSRVAVVAVGSLMAGSVALMYPAPPPPVSSPPPVVATAPPTAPPTRAPTPAPTEAPSTPQTAAPPTPSAPPPPPSTPVPPAPPQVASSHRVALLIGIDHPKGSDPLAGAVTDARYMRDALRLYGWNDSEIMMITEEQATRTNIARALDTFARRSRPGGLAVFAWAGHSGHKSLATWTGARFGKHELASALERVRGKVVIALPTCYSAAYRLPGIVGPGRLTVFSSNADEQTWEIGAVGSHLFVHMIRDAMIGGRAATSVEKSFAYAKRRLTDLAPHQIPIMDDQIAGETKLGPFTWGATPKPDPTPKPTAKPPPTPTPTPSPTPKPRICLLFCR